jgi:TP901 family phage tail tape measure protein
LATKDLVYRIGADLGGLRRAMEEGGKATAAQRRELALLEKQQRAHRQAIGDLGAGMMTFGAAVVAGFAVAGKAAMEWESAFAGVRKTVDGSDQEIAALEGELRKLARTLPATHEEIAGVAEAAGQLGIKRKDIAEFTKTMIDLGETTNLTAEEAATDLAKFSNIMGTSASDVDRLGSALVALGNDGASTEKDIISMALRIAGAGKQLGLSESQVLGFASALSSVGIEAEAGGSSMSTVMIKIAAAVNEGGEAVTAFAEVAGMSAESFSEKFKTDAAGAIIAFVGGLGRMQKSGQDVFGVLDDLGLGEIRVRDAMLRAGSASDMFTKSLQVGSSAWAENTALTDEANKRYQTSASKLQVAGNQIKDALIDVGATVGPVFAGIAQGGSDIAKGFQNLPGPLKDVVTWAGLAAGGLALFGGGAAIAAPKIMDFRDKMRTLESSGSAVGKGLGKVGLFLSGPWGAALGVGAGLLALFAGASGAASRRQEDLASAGKSVAQAIREQNGVINEAVRKTAAKEAQEKGLLSNAKSLGIELGVVTDAILGQGNAYDTLKKKLQDIIKAGTEQATAGKGGAATRFTEEATRAKELLGALDSVVGGKNAELEATKNVDAATKQSTGTQKEAAKTTEELAKEAKNAADALDDMVKALNSMNNTTLSAREAHRAYLEQLVDTAQALKDNGKTLDLNTEKGRKNLDALDAQAGAANKLAEAAAREAESTGGAAAGAAALTASLEASRPQLIETAKQFGLNEQQAKEYADAVLGIPGTAPVLMSTPGSPQALAELQRVREAVHNVPPNKEVNVGVLDKAAIAQLESFGYKVRSLPDGTVMVSAPTGRAEGQLDAFINQRRSLTVTVIPYVAFAQAKMQSLQNAHGNIVSFAGGGIEDHQPQIARATPGTVRVWAESETDKESYIPWAMDRRQRATDILATTAAGFGYDLVPKSWSMARYANGGINGSAAAAVGGRFTFDVSGIEGPASRLFADVLKKSVRTSGKNGDIQAWLT